MVKCNRGCGEANLHWKVVNSKYKLFCDSGLLHICNEGRKSDLQIRESATIKILNELGIKDVKEIPVPDVTEKEDSKEQINWIRSLDSSDPSKCFTINTTSNGVAITGDDKHNAIYLPKIALPELVKALMDFV